jgi:F0F1-type ATP synthase membrane subunit b/b'
MNEILQITLLVLLVVLLVLGVVGLLRISALGRARDEAMREAAEARARSDALGTQVARVESDIRQDLANARSEQASTPQDCAMRSAARSASSAKPPKRN